MADKETSYRGTHSEIPGVAFTLALVFACFTLASTSYLAWLYRLMEFTSGTLVEAITIVGGYSFQALGIGFMCVLMCKGPGITGRLPFITAIAMHFAVAAAAIFATSFAGLIALGYAMNFLCGIVCAFYLHRLTQWVPREHRGATFGGGYACSIATTWMLSMLQGGNPLGSTESVVVCAALSLLAIAMVAASYGISLNQNSQSPEHEPDASARCSSDDKLVSTPANILSLACVTVLLLSLVKNVGFGFPSADLVEGVSLESSRLFYAAGLLIAGFIADTNRKYAALCCVAALVFPFGFLALANEPIPGTILWAVDYLFFGFFSVYRVVLFSDLAEDSGREYLAGFGMLFGRLGDALGTALWLALGTSLVALVAVAAVLFAATIFAFYHLFLRLYPARPAPQKSEQDRFEEFVAAYGVSVREREVLRLVLAERTNAEIAGELFVTEGTVKYHVHNLLKKTDCANRRELISKFAEETQ